MSGDPRRLHPRTYKDALDDQRDKPGMPNADKWRSARDAQRPKGSAWTPGARPEPSRITHALDNAGPAMERLEGPEVDRALGVEEPTVDLWETGELVPTDEQVRRLAVLTGWPVGWFYQPPLPEYERVFICAMPDWAGGAGPGSPPGTVDPPRTRRPWSATPRPKPQPRVPDNPELHPMAAVKAFRKWQEEGGGKAVPPPPGWRPPRREKPKP